MERRDFIQFSCNACLLLAAGWGMTTLEGCGPAAWQVFHADVRDDVVVVPLDTFSKGPLIVVRPKGWFYSIALRKEPGDTYLALLLKCTHQDNQLTAAADGYTCSLHGSAFNKDGRVIKGPAERPLLGFPVTTDNDHLLIHTKA